MNLRMMTFDRAECVEREAGDDGGADNEETVNKVDNIDFTPDGVLVNGK